MGSGSSQVVVHSAAHMGAHQSIRMINSRISLASAKIIRPTFHLAITHTCHNKQPTINGKPLLSYFFRFEKLVYLNPQTYLLYDSEDDYSKDELPE